MNTNTLIYLHINLLSEKCTYMYIAIRNVKLSVIWLKSFISTSYFRVYPKVRFLRTYVSNNKVGYLVDIAGQDRINNDKVDSKIYVYNKQLMFGSLLLFTSDNFNTILCATVLDSSMNLLQDGYVSI